MAAIDTLAYAFPADQIDVVRAELIDDDGEPLETPWHRAEINLLIESLVHHWRGRTDFFVGGNMFIYYSVKQIRKRLYKGPDFFFVNHVDGTRERRWWFVPDEDNRFPDVIIELNSPTTRRTDFTTKKKIYEKQFRTPEYFCCDPDTREVVGWRLGTHGYRPIAPNARGWLWSEQLQLWLGTWQGQYLQMRTWWLRFYDAAGQLVLLQAEALEAEVAHLKAQLAARNKDKRRRKPNGKANGQN